MLEKTEFACTASDGLVLRGMYWHDPEAEPKAAVLFIHGMLEYYGRYDAYASFLAGKGIRFFAFDLRGHGLTSPVDADRGFFAPKKGTDRLMEDVGTVRTRMNEFLAADGLSGLPVFLYGHSMGSFIACCYAKRTAAAGLSGILLSGTTAGNKKAGLGIVLARAQCLVLGPKSKGKFLQNMGFSGYNKRIKPLRTVDDWLSRDGKIVDAYMRDPGCTFLFKAAGMADLATLTKESGGKNWTAAVPKDVSVFLLAGAEDPVGEYGRGPKILAKWFKETGHETMLKLYPDGRHEMHNELNREEVYNDVLSFILLHSQRKTPLGGALASGPGGALTVPMSHRQEETYTMEVFMTLTSKRARGQGITAEAALRAKFASISFSGAASAQFVHGNHEGPVAGVAGIPFSTPVISALLAAEELYPLFSMLFKNHCSVLFVSEDGGVSLYVEDSGVIRETDLKPSEERCVLSVLKDSMKWGGTLNDKGEHTADLMSPAPGPHYFTNFLIGNRIGFDRPLQSTPKSVVDRLGGGSFRSHADTQVLATRWDYLPEENGFPANRQFYLTMNGRQIFYSGLASQEGVEKAFCTHSQNRTVIEYRLTNGLAVRRTIFILPQEDGLPIAVEVQKIEIENHSSADMDLRLVYTGMFGTSECHALREDVIFTTVVAQSEVFYDENEKIAAVSFNPNPKWTKGDIRYAAMMVHNDGEVIFPDQFCAKYSEFVGSGTLSHPENLACLSNRHSRKGPGFFALSAPFTVRAGGKAEADHFTCLSSYVLNPGFVEDETVKEELSALLKRFEKPGEIDKVLGAVEDFAKSYASYLQITHEDKDFEAYVNNNLPFQVFYQTFVSRSFDWTQKGYREIGFREIQDIFASMYYMAGMGRIDFVKKLLREWAGNVALDGYANHNFYWTSKEPGWWSDDSLWLLQALDRYVSLTGDYAFLEEELPVAGTDGMKRSLLKTIRAILTYSGHISVGRHGLPLIDRADWNDCLRVDPDCVSGPDKIAAYKKQLEASGKAYGEAPFESEYSESVMNGFLLKTAVDAAIGIFENCGDSAYASELKAFSGSLKDNLTKSAWKNDFFARVLFNRSSKPDLQYLGAGGDGLAIEEGAPGTYFLNDFSWSVLSGCASESQITVMLDSIDRYLKTPFGYRLCSSVDYPKIAPKIDVALYYTGDRENGGIFKHANMMAAAAMLKAAKSTEDIRLAERLSETAYWVIDCILPYRTLKNPFETCGNPRLCTQYNNSETGENIGPTLSGTSTWLLLCMFMGFGVEFTSDALILDPILRSSDSGEDIMVNSGKASYHIKVTKPAGFRRTKEGARVVCDGKPVSGIRIPVFEDGETHEIQISL